MCERECVFVCVCVYVWFCRLQVWCVQMCVRVYVGWWMDECVVSFRACVFALIAHMCAGDLH